MAKFIDGRTIVADIQRNVRLSAVSLIAEHVDVVALATNTDTVWIGSDRVNATSGGERGMPLLKQDVASWDNVDLSTIYIAAEVANEGVTWLATVP